ncbi:MAG: hypothetical protein O2968_19865, partial [Acidobacteria bacterium]|nr:hypothetical protein [Acidobacteriota bacterium]
VQTAIGPASPGPPLVISFERRLKQHHLYVPQVGTGANKSAHIIPAGTRHIGVGEDEIREMFLQIGDGLVTVVNRDDVMALRGEDFSSHTAGMGVVVG